MFEALVEMFSYPFILRALIVGLLIAVCASLLGVSLVLKRFSMIGDGLSHVGFGSLAIAIAFNAAPLAVSLPIVSLAALLLLRLSESSRIKGDAAIALVSTGALAVGVTIISLSTGFNIDVYNYLFGSILAMSKSDVGLSIVITLIVLVAFVLFYHKIFAVTYDEGFARALGLHTQVYTIILALLTAVVVVVGMRMMGALLISALIIFPALTAMRLCKSYRTVTLCSMLVALACFALGAFASYYLNLPTGSSVVLANILAFLLFWLIRLALRRTS